MKRKTETLLIIAVILTLLSLSCERRNSKSVNAEKTYNKSADINSVSEKAVSTSQSGGVSKNQNELF